MRLDLTLDFRLDSKNGDPDTNSKSLKWHHQHIWSKQLPNGDFFSLELAPKPGYLTYRSPKEVFYLTSDSISHSYANRKRYLNSILAEIPKKMIESFQSTNATFGGYIIFPGNRIQGKQTINAARGCKKAIDDRFDLTLECIRRLYLSQLSPLSEVLDRYKSFFDLFVDFKGYVNFFYLNDLVSDDYRSVKLLLGKGDPFALSPLPKSASEYLVYRENAMNFINLRSVRIEREIMSSTRFVWTDEDNITIIRKD